MEQRHRAVPAALAAALCLCLLPRLAGADPIDPKQLPRALEPWVPWVLHGQQSATCPLVLGKAKELRCNWPSRLELKLDDRGGRFTQQWHLHARGWVALPGDAKRWPQDVRVGAARGIVVDRGGVPSIRLPAGDHRVSGAFLWDALPESLQIPHETGLLALTVRGTAVRRPNRQASGLVFLQQAAGATEGERLEVLVHRKVTDDNPLLLTTRISLNVAGKNREVLLGRALPDGFVPMALQTDLPARIEPDSRVRVQVRPGTWTLTITARSKGPVNELRRPRPGGPWREGDEVWVFEARSALRLATIEGVTAVDPQQTSLPADWKRLPAYPMKLKDTMKLVQKRRGDADPTPDRLTLARVLWLDFDGAGLTASDTITGTLRRASRLEMTPPTRLGRVSVGGRDQFITHLGDASRMGVELRPGQLSLSADSRIESSSSTVPATGWNRDFHQVATTLNLPPGWRLLHASGVDEVPGTWLRHWTLLEIFLVLVLSIATWRLFGLGWGILGLLTFVLVFPEGGAPRWIWVAVLTMEGLHRAADSYLRGRSGEPPRWPQRVIGITRHAVAVVLVLVAIPFLIQHVRVGLYPALELEGQLADLAMMAGVAPSSPMMPHQQALTEDRPAAPPQVAAEGEPQEQTALAQTAEKLRTKDVSRALAGKKKQLWKSRGYGERQFNVEVYDPKAMVQTGPGRPRWQWKSFSLGWSGPVQRGQELRLMLTSPASNLVLSLLRALLLAVLVLRLVPWRLPRLPFRRAGTAAGLLLLLFPASARAQLPGQELLDQLRDRLLARPDCAPTCAASPRMLLQLRQDRLTARMELIAAAATAVPLPGNAAQWIPSRVILDGRPASGLARDSAGVLWLLLEAGTHQVLLEGPMPGGESVQLSLPLKPRRVEATLDGWRVDGLHEDGLADDDLQLTRVRGEGGAAALQPGTLPPFVRVERTLLIGLNWQVETRVVRVTEPGVAVVQEIPLLPGESVTTADVRVVKGRALVNMGPQASEMVWRSVLREKSPILLAAPRAAGWTEVWQLEVSPIWHAAASGIPAVHPEQVGQAPQWRPWPGESVRIDITRPSGVPGRTITVDQSWYRLDPGLRATDARLKLVVRSSRGAQHTLTLPAGAVVETLKINGATHPFRQVGRKVTLALVPGSQNLQLTWREPRGISTGYRVAAPDLGVPSVNASTDLGFSNARWILFTTGPRLGPVVRFWSLLLVLLVVALALGQVRWVPLRWWHWLLLAIGLSQIHLVLAALLVGWLLLLGWRGRGSASAPDIGRFWFNARQIVILVATFIAILVLVLAVHEGLLGRPEMQIAGNGSGAEQLRWFQDRADSTPAAPWVLSAPLFVYRAAMLAWALWLAFAVLRWFRWGWGAFGQGGMWVPAPPRPPRPRAAARAGAPPPTTAAPPPAAPPPQQPAPRDDEEG